MTNDHTYSTATELLAGFKEKSISPVEFMQSIITRAESVEPEINAFADRCFDEAMEKAGKAEARYMNPKSSPRSLEGIPLAVKDDTPIKGKCTTGGSIWMKNHIDEYSNPSVERLIRAGAIVHARTTCPEFCWMWITSSRLHGVTRNPWNRNFSPGGSSGGSAASLAAGSTVLATGTDSAGSIRQPAALCGVVGFKPPYGRNPQSPQSSFDVYNHIGPIARSVGDCALMQNVMSGPHSRDHNSIHPKLNIPAELKSVKGMKIAWSMNLGYYEVSRDVQQETLNTLDQLSDGGATIEQVDTNWAVPALQACGFYGGHLYSGEFEEAIRKYPDSVCDYTTWFAKRNREITQKQFHQAHSVAGETWYHHFGPMMDKYDAFICPTTTDNNLPADMRPWETVEVNGNKVSDYDTTMTHLFNMFSRCPVLSVPSGFNNNGMPTGIQIVGKPYHDVTVFELGSYLETVSGRTTFISPGNHPM